MNKLLIPFLALFVLSGCNMVNTGGLTQKPVRESRLDQRVGKQLEEKTFRQTYKFDPVTEVMVRTYSETSVEAGSNYNIEVEIPKNGNYAHGILWVKYIDQQGEKIRLNRGSRYASGRGVDGDYFIQWEGRKKVYYVKITPLPRFRKSEIQRFEIALTDKNNRVVVIRRTFITRSS